MKFIKRWRFGRLVEAADRARDERNWREASANYRAALELISESADIWVRLGRCARETGDYYAAEEAYERARALDPQAFDGDEEYGHSRISIADLAARGDLLARADAARDAGQFATAAQLYQEVARLTPSPHILVQIGNALKEIGNLGAAEEAYLQALELRPEDADCHLQLGHLMKLSGQSQRALSNYARADALDPQRPDARREMHALVSDQRFDSGLRRTQIPENIRISVPLTKRFFEQLRWLAPDAPQVSIVILSYLRPDLVENLVKSIFLFSAGYRYEIIVVDNGSPPGEHVLSPEIAQRVTIVRLAHNRYRGDAYNIGVERAKGEYVVLMHNDIVVENGWLRPLIALLENDPTVAAVGPKFLYPSGQLQEAGALIDSTGHAAQRGKRASPDSPEFNELTEVHFCTGATIATRRALFIDALGYDWRWSPVFYEDADLCFKFRDRGMRVMFMPESSVFHIESATMAEHPPSANLDAAFRNNRERFAAKWATLLTRDRTAPETRITKPDGVNLKRYQAITASRPKRAKRIAVVNPYEYIPGGGEKFALSIAEQFADEAEIYLVLESCESILRAMSVNEDLGFAELPFHLITFDEAKDAQRFDVFILIGNELLPTRPALGKRNYFNCQFPFPVSHDFLTHYHDAGYYRDYDAYIVNSEYTRMHVANQLDARQVKVPIAVLSPTADLVGTTGDKKPEIISVGRFFTGGHNKRHDIVIEVMKQVMEAAPQLQARLHLAGAVHNAEFHRRHLQTLRELAQGLPISFHLDVERPELDALYRSSKVYLHAGGWGVDTAANPEAVEHFGISILEAMSAGCVPVAYAVGGPTETIRHGVNGALVLSVAEMADWTIRLLRDWDTPLVRAMRDSAVRTAQSYGKPAFGARVRQLIALTPREEASAHCPVE